VDVYPVLIDSRPPSWNGSGWTSSLLQVPLGPDSLLGHLCSRLETVTPHRPVVRAPAGAGNEYRREFGLGAPVARIAISAVELEDALADLEPSDSLLVVDPRCFPADGFDPQVLVSESGADPRWASHLVALAEGGAGTKEYADFDGEGRVRRIQRYYDAVTWPFIAGVVASLVPVSAVRGEGFAATSLVELRSRLAARGVPSRDLPLTGAAFDLGGELGLLSLNERFVLKAITGRGSPEPLLVGDGQAIHPSARLIGPVIVHRDVVIEEDVIVLGPALLGAGARIGRGSIVAQSVVGPGCVVTGHETVRQCVILSGEGARPAASSRSLPLPQVTADDGHGEDMPRTRYIRVKRVLETAVAALALLLLLPLLLLIALLIALNSRGPVLYGHDREGWRGRRFRCWKFRTMYMGAEALERELQAQSLVDGPQFKLVHDPRITRTGRLLRPSSLDELPQLINVVRGEMALVGPRPSPFRENQLCVPWRTGRLQVRPGITGLWQVCRHDRAGGDFHQWIEYDLLYVRQMSLALDLRILAATVLTLGGRKSVPLSWVLPGVSSRRRPAPPG